MGAGCACPGCFVPCAESIGRRFYPGMRLRFLPPLRLFVWEKRALRRACRGFSRVVRAGELLCLRRVFTTGAAFFATAGMVKSPRAVCARAPFRCLCALAPVRLGKRPFRRACGGIFTCCRAGIPCAPFAPLARPCACLFGKTSFPPRMRRDFPPPCGLGMRCRLQSRIVRIRVPLPHPAYPPHNFLQEGGFFT